MGPLPIARFQRLASFPQSGRRSCLETPRRPVRDSSTRQHPVRFAEPGGCGGTDRDSFRQKRGDGPFGLPCGSPRPVCGFKRGAPGGEHVRGRGPGWSCLSCRLDAKKHVASSCCRLSSDRTLRDDPLRGMAHGGRPFSLSWSFPRDGPRESCFGVGSCFSRFRSAGCSIVTPRPRVSLGSWDRLPIATPCDTETPSSL